MNIPTNISGDEKPQINYISSNFTWFVVAAAGITIVPYTMCVITFVNRALKPILFLEQLGVHTRKSMSGTEDLLTYVLMLFSGIEVFGILVGLFGTVIMLLYYNSELGFRVIRAGCGTAIACQGILIICACTIWIAKALALLNGDVIENGVRVVYTSERLNAMSSAVFLNDGIIWGVWVIILPLFAMMYFSEKDFKRREPSHI